MGILRTLLALFVVAGHMVAFDSKTEIGYSGGAVMAVNLFFIISGFYMALILSSKYKGQLKLFYTNRALRLFPLYWATFLATSILMCWYREPWAFGFAYDAYAQMIQSHSAWWLIPITIISNATFFGIDLATISCVDFSRGTLHLFNHHSCSTMLNSLSLVPQAWTLGIEVMFYLLIPVILRFGKNGILAALTMALLARISLYFTGLNVEPWNRSLFITTLIFFMLGVVALELYKKIAPSLPKSRLLWLSLPIAVFILIAYVYFYPRLSSQPTIAMALNIFIEPLFFLFFTLLIPFIFHASKDSWIDRFIGELSYPIYITHFFTLALASHYLHEVAFLNTRFLGIGTGYLRFGSYMGMVILVSAIGVILAVQPIEIVRRKLATTLLVPARANGWNY